MLKNTARKKKKKVHTSQPICKYLLCKLDR